MNEKELRRLMNDQLDGVATPEDSETLKQRLAGSPEARAKFRELGEVFASLNRVEMVDPPSDLAQNVLRSIRLRSEPAPERPGWLASLLGAFRARPALQYAYPFVAGAGVAIVAFALLTGNPRIGPSKAENPFAGSMLPTSNLSGFQRVDGREYRLMDGRVGIETFSSKDGLVARVQAQGSVGSEIEITYDPASLSAVALRQRHAGGNGVSIAQGVFRIRFQDPGESQYLLYLARTKPGGSPLRVSVKSGAGIYQGELRLDTLQPGTR